MGNACSRRGKAINPGSALDLVISQASSDDCILYKLADYKKNGRLLEEYARGGGKEVERLILEEFGVFMYHNGKGMQITRTEYLKWKYRKVPKDQMVLQMETKSPFDPLKKWQDHEACWKMEFRGSLGESLLHVLIMCDTEAHTRIAKILLKCFPKMALDVVEGEEYLGASSLHLAIAYNNNDLVMQVVNVGAKINQRAIGSFFLPKDQQVEYPPGYAYTDYEGLAYLGEYPLAWSACLANETAYNRLLDHGASPNLKDSFGNMILHMVVICNQLGMFGYALRHPRLPAQDGIVNKAGLTPLTLACKLARSTIFKEMLELTCIEFWRYSNITCSAYPLNALDTIKPSGDKNFNSGLMIILNGTKSEHLDMLEGGIIQRLLEEKWKTFARNQFIKRVIIMLLQLLTFSVAIYLRPCYCGPSGLHMEDPAIRKKLYNDFFSTNAGDIVRYCFEVIVLLEVFFYLFIQQVGEITNQGFFSYLKEMKGNPPKVVFLASNILLVMCIPCRISYFFSVDLNPRGRIIEDEFLAYGAAGSWFMLMFYAGALKLTGPFVVMIYKMISGDMFTFSIIYGILLLGFTQAFYFLYKKTPLPDDNRFATYKTTWMGLLHMTLGDYDYSVMGQTIYSSMTKFVFLIFTIMVPILLLNMLIAMMGNTYSTVISMSEKEWMKQWAKIVIALENAISKEKLKDYLYKYSVPIGRGTDGEESLGVMVIKSANKTKAKQRKGALSNWKRVGKVTIGALKKRGVSGEFLRREMWGLQSACTTPLKGIKKKGGVGSYDVKAGVSLTNTMDNALESKNWESDSQDKGDGDVLGGFGALSGAIDQLTFACDLDFSGDGVEHSNMKPSRRPEGFSAEIELKKLEEAKKNKQKKRFGINNLAFIDDTELVLAAGLAPEHDEESDDESRRRSHYRQPRIIVQPDPPKEAQIDKTGKKSESSFLPPIRNPRERPTSSKLRRLGSAKRKFPRYGVTFTERMQASKNKLVAMKPETVVGNGAIVQMDSHLKLPVEEKEMVQCKESESTEIKNTTEAEHKPVEVEYQDNKLIDKKSKVRNNKVEPCVVESKAQFQTLPSKESKEEIKTGEEQTSSYLISGSGEEADRKSSESTASVHTPPTSVKDSYHTSTPETADADDVKCEEAISATAVDPASSDATAEGKIKEDSEMSKTPALAKARIKTWSTDNVSDMNTILPWSNEEGDIN